MPQILVEGLAKTYRVAERQPGAWGAVTADGRTNTQIQSERYAKWMVQNR